MGIGAFFDVLNRAINVVNYRLHLLLHLVVQCTLFLLLLYD